MDNFILMPSETISAFDNDVLYSLLESFPEAILLISKNLKIVYINRACEIMLNQSRSEILGRDVGSSGSVSLAKMAVNSGNVVSEKTHLTCLDIDVDGTAFPLVRDGGLIGAAVVINPEVEDIRAQLDKAYATAEYLKEQLKCENRLPKPIKRLLGYNIHNNEIMALAAKVARTDSTVLIRGESGVGKEVVTRAIVGSSNRADRPFVTINCAALPENLLEAELFGYENGAFTGAKRGGQKGKFEQAHKGTLFLDEVGDMSLTM